MCRVFEGVALIMENKLTGPVLRESVHITMLEFRASLGGFSSKVLLTNIHILEYFRYGALGD